MKSKPVLQYRGFLYVFNENPLSNILLFPTPYRGDDQHDQLAVAYQLVLDNRAVSKATGETPPNIGASISTSPPRSSFTMKEGGVATPGPTELQRPVSVS